MHSAQRQRQQQNDSGFTSHVDQTPNTPEHISVRPENVQSSSPPSALQSPPALGQQVPFPSIKIADLSLAQLCMLHAQVSRTLVEGEEALQASRSSASGSEGDIQLRQELRAKLDAHKEHSLALQELINAKAMASGDPTQLATEPSWLGQNQRPTALYPMPERSGQHDGPSLHRASVNQVPLQPSQIVESSSQQPIQPHRILPLPEHRFKSVFTQFLATAEIRVTERDIVIEGRPVNLWALHKAVLLRNGFESVCANDEWPLVGVTVGFPVFSGGDGGQPARCAPAVAHRLQQLYNDALRLFEQAYVSSLGFLSRKKVSSQMPPQAPQPQAQPHQPTEEDYEALLARIYSESPNGLMIMNVLSRFAHTSGAELEAHGVPQHFVAIVEQHRELLQNVALHGIQFDEQLELPRPTATEADYAGSVAGAGQGFQSHGQQLPLTQQPPLTMDELEEAVRSVKI